MEDVLQYSKTNLDTIRWRIWIPIAFANVFFVSCSNGGDDLPFRTLSHGREVKSVSFSPDGSKLLVTSAYDRLTVWSTRAWTVEKRIDLHLDVAKGRWIPGSNDMMLMSRGSGLSRLSLKNGKTKWDIGLVDPNDFTTPTGLFIKVSPDGSNVALDAAGEQLQVRDAETGALVWAFPLPVSLPGEFHYFWDCAYYPSGQRLAVVVQGSKNESTVYILSAGDGAPESEIDVDGIVEDIAISPDEALIATAMVTGEVRIYESARPHRVRAVVAPPRWGDRGAVPVAFSPSGKELAVSLSEVYTFSTSSWKRLAVYRVSDIVLELAYSPDGSLLVASTQLGEVYVWKSR